MTNSGRRLSRAASRGLRGLALAALLGAACTRVETTPVARGEYYAAGHPDYDEFFVQLYHYQLETAAALKLEAAARRELSLGLGAKSDKPKQLSPLLRQRAAELERQGVKVVVTAGKEPPLVISGEAPDEQRRFLDALRSSALKLGNVAAATGDAAAVDRLRARVSELERRADTAFWSEGASKRSEVKRNLSDGQKLLVLIGDSRKQLAQSSGALLHDLEQIFAPPRPAPAPVAAEPEPKPKKRAPRRSYAPPAAPAASPAAPAAPKPAAPKPPPRSDFEP